MPAGPAEANNSFPIDAIAPHTPPYGPSTCFHCARTGLDDIERSRIVTRIETFMSIDECFQPRRSSSKPWKLKSFPEPYYICNAKMPRKKSSPAVLDRIHEVI